MGVPADPPIPTNNYLPIWYLTADELLHAAPEYFKPSDPDFQGHSISMGWDSHRNYLRNSSSDQDRSKNCERLVG